MKFQLLLNKTQIESYLYLTTLPNRSLKGLNLCFWIPPGKEQEMTQFMADVSSAAGINTPCTIHKSHVATSPQCKITRTEYCYNFEDTIEKIDIIVGKFGFKLKL